MLAMNDQVDTLIIIIITNEHIHEKIAVKQLKAKKIFNVFLSLLVGLVCV